MPELLGRKESTNSPLQAGITLTSKIISGLTIRMNGQSCYAITAQQLKPEFL